MSLISHARFCAESIASWRTESIEHDERSALPARAMRARWNDGGTDEFTRISWIGIAAHARRGTKARGSPRRAHVGVAFGKLRRRAAQAISAESSRRCPR